MNTRGLLVQENPVTVFLCHSLPAPLLLLSLSSSWHVHSPRLGLVISVSAAVTTAAILAAVFIAALVDMVHTPIMVVRHSVRQGFHTHTVFALIDELSFDHSEGPSPAIVTTTRDMEHRSTCLSGIPRTIITVSRIHILALHADDLARAYPLHQLDLHQSVRLAEPLSYQTAQVSLFITLSSVICMALAIHTSRNSILTSTLPTVSHSITLLRIVTARETW